MPLLMMMMILAHTDPAAVHRRVLRLRIAAGGGAGTPAAPLAALLAAHDARQQVRLAAQERLVRELPPVGVHRR